MLNNQTKKQQGISLYLAVVILAVLLSICLGLSALLIYQIKMLRGMEESVIAFYAADTGIEALLKTPVADTGEVNLPNGASYIVQIRCNPLYIDCIFGTDSNCDAPRICVKSKGIFRNVQRAIEVEY